MIHHGDVSLGQELTDAQGIMSLRVVLVKQSCHCPATTRASSCALNEASAAGSLYRHAG